MLDVDDVLVDTDEAEKAASLAFRASVTTTLGEDHGKQMADSFEQIHQVLIQELRTGVASEEYRRVIRDLRQVQVQVYESGYQVKTWSREAAAELSRRRCDFTCPMQLIEEALAFYWRLHRESLSVFDDALRFVTLLRASETPYLCASDSDGILRFSSTGLYYDPKHARRKKLWRLHHLFRAGIEERDLLIGDPIGKPETDFFAEAISRLRVPVGQVIPVGDSYARDVFPVLEMGARRGYVLSRRSDAQVDDHRVKVIRSLDDIEVRA